LNWQERVTIFCYVRREEKAKIQRREKERDRDRQRDTEERGGGNALHTKWGREDRERERIREIKRGVIGDKGQVGQVWEREENTLPCSGSRPWDSPENS
jgi:hypothetical protein